MFPSREQQSAAQKVLEGRHAVLEAITALRHELEVGPDEEWKNDPLARFLDAFGELLGVIENNYANTGRQVPADPWVVGADAPGGARSSE